MKRFAPIIATVFYIGHLRPAPGTWGSLLALPYAWILWWIGGMWLFLIAIPIGFVKGLWATQVYTDGSDNHDPSEVVVDEVIGQWIALSPVIVGATMMGHPVLDLYPGWIAAFVLFRLFDIWKPWIIGKADRRGDVMGVMLDDVWAGVFAAIGVVLLAALSHVLIM